MIVRLRHVKRVRAKGHTYWYHQITRERLPEDREDRAARVLEINRNLKGTVRKIGPGSLAGLSRRYSISIACSRTIRKTLTSLLAFAGVSVYLFRRATICLRSMLATG